MAKIEDKKFSKEVLDFDGDKYDMSVLSSLWAKQLKRREEFRYKPNAAVIRVALDDILSGKVTREDVLEVSSRNIVSEMKAKQEAIKEKEKKLKEPLKL